ncbi:Os05g0181902, partial [Oryza sativa Japonica Group]
TQIHCGEDHIHISICMTNPMEGHKLEFAPNWHFTNYGSTIKDNSSHL